MYVLLRKVISVTLLTKLVDKRVKGRFILDLAIDWKRDFADTIARVC